MPPILLAALVSFVIAVMSLGQISPSIVNAVAAQNVNTSVAREGALAQQVMRYKANVGSFPADMATLISAGYWRTADNNNALGGTYSFAVDATKGTIAVSTSIADATKRAQYLASSRRTFKPVDLGGGSVSTTFMIPTAEMSSSLPAGIIPVSVYAPNPLTTAYWYDISSGTPILKVSNGVAWTNTVAHIATDAAPSAANIVASAAALPASAAVGDVRYVYNSTTSSLDTMYYYNGAWVAQGAGTNPSVMATLATAAIPAGYFGVPYYYDFRPKVSAIFVNTYGAAPVVAANVRWFAMTALPAGLSLNSTTGVLSGTPSASTVGTTITLQAVYENSTSAASYTLVINPALVALSTATLTVGTQNTAYTYDFKPRAGVIAPTTAANLTWAASGLPAGLSINASTGVLSGTPTGSTAGTTITITASHAGTSLSQTYTIVVNAGAQSLEVVVGGWHTCALNTSTGSVKCWGLNNTKQLGDGTTSNSPMDGSVATPVASGATAIALSETGTCALFGAGTLKCWGYNSWQFGAQASIQYATPTILSGFTGLTQLSIESLDHGCGIFTGGAVKCWGADNYYRKIGNEGALTYGNVAPFQIPSITSGATSVAVAHDFSCAVVGGGVKCWGYGGLGAFGSGANYTPAGTPIQVIAAGSGVVSVHTGKSHTYASHMPCALYGNGQVQCWATGYNGNGVYVSASPPTNVGGTQDYVKIAVGYMHICGVTTGGAVRCWGSNSGAATELAGGALGNGMTNVNVGTPTAVSGITGAVDISAGIHHTCVKLNTGMHTCFGYSSYGVTPDSLGTGTPQTLTVP